MRKDIAEVGVAEVRVSLSLITNTCCSELEGINSPFQALVPIRFMERQLAKMSDSSRIHLSIQLTPSQMAGSST